MLTGLSYLAGQIMSMEGLQAEAIPLQAVIAEDTPIIIAPPEAAGLPSETGRVPARLGVTLVGLVQPASRPGATVQAPFAGTASEASPWPSLPEQVTRNIGPDAGTALTESAGAFAGLWGELDMLGCAQCDSEMVVFNAAMLPGWPYTRPCELQSQNAILRAAVEKLAMSPEEMAKYLARFGAQLARLAKVQRITGADGREAKVMLGLIGMLTQVAEHLLHGMRMSLELMQSGQAEPLEAAGIKGSARTGRVHFSI